MPTQPATDYIGLVFWPRKLTEVVLVSFQKQLKSKSQSLVATKKQFGSSTRPLAQGFICANTGEFLNSRIKF